MSDALYFDPEQQPGDEHLPDWQQNFNRYIREIRTLKERLQAAEKTMQQIEGRIQREINPMVEQVIAHKVKFVEILDEAYQKGYFVGRERERISQLIQSRCFELMYKHGQHDMEKMYRKYSYDPLDRFGLFDFAEETMSSFFSAFFEEPTDPQPDFGSEAEPEKPRFRKHKRFRQEADQLQRVLRNLYTRLVKHLHPDREQDEKRREEKTLIMQQVTEAYEQQDWFELLRLQSEYLKEEPQAIETLTPEQIRRLNQELHEQLRELEKEWEALTESGDSGFIYRRFAGENKDETDRKFSLEKLRLQNELMKLRDELEEVLEKRQAPRFRLRD